MKKLALLLAFLFFSLASCASSPSYQVVNFFSMDTFAEVRAYTAKQGGNDALIACKQVAADLEKKISATKEESDTFAFNRLQTQEFSEDFMDLLRLSLQLSELTDGAFDVTSGWLIELWKACEIEGRLPTDEELLEGLGNTGYSQIKLQKDTVTKHVPDLLLDFGAIGKGYAADKMAESLKGNGVLCAMITFVSSVTVFGERDFKIGIRKPDTSGELCGYVTLRDASLSVSGDYERFYVIGGKQYPHILDTKTGKPVQNGIHSVVVIAKSGAVADALSTAIFVMGIEKAAEFYQKGELSFEFLCVTDTETIASDGFLSHFEGKDGYRPLSLSQYILER